MNIFQLSCTTQIPVVGAYPQVASYSAEGAPLPYDQIWRDRKNDGPVFELTGDLDPEASMTQILSCKYISPGIGLIMDDEVLKLVRNYLPDNHTLHPFTVQDRMNDATHACHFLEIRTSTGLADAIDFERSVFCKSAFDEDVEDIQVSTWEDWYNLQNEENGKGASITIEPKTLFVSAAYLNKCGIIKFPFNSRNHITPMVREILEKHKISGARITENKRITITTY